MNLAFLPPNVPLERIETRKVLKLLTEARASLAELKGAASTIPNEQILIDTLSLQEAKDSSAIENIVTTHDELYRSEVDKEDFASASAKEVHRYAEALKYGFDTIRRDRILTTNSILKIQEIIEGNSAGVRKVPGTVLKNDLTGEVVYTPPQDFQTIQELLSNLEKFINNDLAYDADPLVRMAIIHHQFESIHPFFDGNGRTGRIINILYLINEGLLNLPVLYLSRYIIKNRPEYYKLLQSTRISNEWEPWVIFMLKAVEETSKETVVLIKAIKSLMLSTKKRIREEQSGIYSQDLINNLFRHPYTKIDRLQKDLHISRITSTRYLNILTEMGILNKQKLGRSNYYVNIELFKLLSEGVK
ncbi:Fic family protein [uncultured Roseivirga sp.]|uniref:Fic family protein n=1 Tax=uncultured Roseivirga sp. TaxID=543088 RepID=UPI000D7B8A29|nr:Fic family protein [uncultured Roseivirga sp.]PWL30656.1 MAG: addiction module protein [Roseivirga sp. XM-24bin3]